MADVEQSAAPDLTPMASALRAPDFYIVGAPRSGTTFLYEYLGRHPQIYMAERKEPQFFARDLDSGSFLESVTFMRDRGEYLALFAKAKPGQVTGEGSTWYLYSESAARLIKAERPDARIIAMLRDPVEMLYSLHGRRYYAGSEDIPEFAVALAAEEDRRQGIRIPSKARNVKALYYRAVGSYAAQVERYLEAFGRDQVKVVIFEEFVRDPATAYHEILRFLGVDPAFEPEFKVVNASMARRSRRIQQLLFTPTLIRTARLLIPARARPRVGRMWDAINSRRERRPALDPEVALALRRELLPDIERLGTLLGRDLTQVWT
jgi:hypothetical protein